MSAMCSYCSQFHALHDEAVFCSRHTSLDPKMKNNLFYFPKGIVIGEDHISRYTFRYSFKGYQHYKIDGKDRTIAPESMLFVNAGQGFDTDTVRGSDVELMMLSVNEEFIQSVLRENQSSPEELIDNPEKKVPIPERSVILKDNAKINGLMSELKKVMVKRREAEDLDDLLSEMVTVFFSHQAYLKDISLKQFEVIKKSTKLELDKRMTRARDYIEAHLTSPLDLNKLCKEVGMSKYHFSRCFKTWMGISPLKYLQQIRIKFAKTVLIRNSMTVLEVSELLCYESPDSFARAFKRNEGRSPSSRN
jgi:AraC family transcriptional regulator